MLPAAWGGGGAGCRMAPRSSSPPRELESDAQTASPARARTPGETRHSHTAPYTLREKTERYTHTLLHTLRERAYGTDSFRHFFSAFQKTIKHMPESKEQMKTFPQDTTLKTNKRTVTGLQLTFTKALLYKGLLKCSTLALCSVA